MRKGTTRRSVAFLSALLLVLGFAALVATPQARADHLDIAATGRLQVEDNPTDGDTMTIGSVTYTFKDAPSLANDIDIGGSVSTTRNNIEAALASHPDVDIDDFNDGPNNDLNLTAKVAGLSGNSIVTTETFTSGDNFFDDPTLTGGDSLTASANNPDLTGETCSGLNLVLLMDSSGSIGTANGEQDVIDAYFAILNGLNNTGSQAGVVDFDQAATVEINDGGAGGPHSYLAINDANIAGAFDTYASSYTAGGVTNWEDAFIKAGEFADPDLVVMITDGDPTEHNPPDAGTEPLFDSLEAAIVAANAVKTGGAHILMVGVAGPTTANLVDVSGPDVDVADVTELDVITTDFAGLSDDIAAFVAALCPPVISVDKTPTPDNVDEPGGSIDFEVAVTNNSADQQDFELTDLTDDVYGDITSVQGDVTATDCSVPQTIVYNDTYTCTFTANVTGNGDDTHENTVTATGEDPDGNEVMEDGTAQVDINDVLPNATVDKTADPGDVDEPGGSVTYTVTVTNNGPEALTLTDLTDDQFGDITSVQGDVTATTCSVPQNLAANGGDYTCEFDANVSGNGGGSHDNTVTATVEDDDGNEETPNDDESVDINDVLPDVEVDKDSVTTDVDEPGDDVVFDVTVTNNGPEPVDLTSLTDDQFGDITQVQGDISATTCSVPQAIAADGGTYECSFTAFVGGDPGDVHTNIVTGAGEDDEGNPFEETGSHTVNVNDVASAITVEKDASPEILDPFGEVVTYTVTVTNDSLVDTVTITSLVDDVVGDLNGLGDCTVPQDIDPGNNYQCSFTDDHTGDAPGDHTNTVTASGTDDDGDPVEDDDSSTVTIPATPAISILKGNQGDPESDFQIVDEGQDATWTIVVENTGNTTLSNVIVTDVLAPDCDRDSGDIADLASMAPGDVVQYDCTLQNVQNFLINVAEVVGSPPQGEDVTDDDSSPISFISASAAVGDTVFLDEDGDGIEDPEDEGVPNAEVELYICNDPPVCDDIVLLDTTITDGDGHYEFINLPVGDYLVVIDTGTVDGDLTTPGEFVVLLGSGEEFLNADFGIEEELPVTGIDADRLGWFAVVILALGGMMLLGSGLRRREN